jgi:predicted dehydrogenase
MWQNSVGAWLVYSETDPAWPWADGLNHLVDCIRERMQPLITPEHAYHVLEIMLKAQDAGRDGRAHAIESRFTLPVFPPPKDERPAYLVNDRNYRR